MIAQRCALYARYSSDRQNERSIDQQLALLTTRAALRRWTVAATFHDAGISGEAMANRPGLQMALAAAGAGGFDILLVEHEDRLARNLEHQSHVFNRLTDLGVSIATLNTDRVELIHVALNGYLAQAWVDGHRQKTSRGMRDNAERGLAFGSRIYGYRSAPGGAREIVPAEAEVVRRIFALYAEDRTGREIADELNRDRIKSPSGGWWNASTILGSPKRGNGVLRTELYNGTQVYNRFLMKKDRATGRRISIAIPPEEWRRTPVPALAILPAGRWDQVQARLQARASVGGRRPEAMRRYPGVFSGLLKCRCGAAYTVASKVHLRCASNAYKGAQVCDNGRRVRRADVEARVLSGLQAQLLHPDLVKAYVAEVRAAERERRAAALGRRGPIERRMAELERTLERMVDAIADTDDGFARVKGRMAAAEGELKELKAELRAIDDASDVDLPIELHPRAADAYRHKVAALQAELEAHAGKSDAADRQLVDLVRDLVDRVEILPTGAESADPVDLVVHGRMARLFESGETLVLQGMDALVAGGGIEPPT